MSSQIFKNKIPDEFLFVLLDKICLKTDNFYTFNSDAFKKGIYNDTIQQFIIDCTPYYYLSKRKYLERKLTYNSFVTILRQICKYNKITYTSEIKYNKSVYDIVYFIYFHLYP
jgi:hypothetical protein